ncbi:hypothetical protein [Qipengyuania qiaonensis]|uniref:Uncharacterized protein n=1 Tax=Qipengyuania qiaonensis TaxID=2867240 RepID=A0ABS7J4R7_9SPHN|nr:hypothetical protein [Qipengyuania qiaonensis]MBX7482333.1 hypothetical protein [Qipengyuania qiaonensis]
MGIFSRVTRRTPEPDIEFAARGFVQVAITRRHAPHLDLHKLERGYAAELLEEGCSLEQALSARWGGAYAITANLSEFDEAIETFKDTMADALGRRTFKTADEAKVAYQSAAVFLLGVAHAVDPREYGRFLDYIGAR